MFRKLVFVCMLYYMVNGIPYQFRRFDYALPIYKRYTQDSILDLPYMGHKPNANPSYSLLRKRSAKENVKNGKFIPLTHDITNHFQENTVKRSDESLWVNLL